MQPLAKRRCPRKKRCLARRQAASEVLLDIDENARRAMAIDPALMLAGDTPRLTDPDFPNHNRFKATDHWSVMLSWRVLFSLSENRS